MVLTAGFNSEPEMYIHLYMCMYTSRNPFSNGLIDSRQDFTLPGLPKVSRGNQKCNMSTCLSLRSLRGKFQKHSLSKDVLNQLVHTLGNSLCEAFHVGKRSIVL